MTSTPFHAYYTARILETLQDDDKFIPTFASSDIKVYPYQVGAALFATRSPYSKPFIPITTEYILLFHKEDIFLIPFSKTLSSTFDVSKRDDITLTWHHLVRMTMEDMGGESELKELYARLADHPKAQKNKHYKDRIRATICEHKDQYLPCATGGYRLNYKVA